MKRRLRRRSPPRARRSPLARAANDVWCIDFKGWFRTGDGTRCEPLTLSDAYSRYLLRCQALARTDTEHVWPVLDAAFREFGLPQRLRSDNGPPFASRGAGGLSQLSVKVIKAGVTPERIAPGKPQQNGRPRAAAPDAAAGHRQPAGAQPARAARALPTLPAPLQRGAPARRRSATPRRPSATPPRRGAGTACCASPDYGRHDGPPRASQRRDQVARQPRSTSARRWSASRSVSPKTRTAAGRSATARSCSASSPIAATVCDKPQTPGPWTCGQR